MSLSIEADTSESCGIRGNDIRVCPGLRRVLFTPGGEQNGWMRIGVKPGQYGWSFDELVASWEVAETVGFDVLACFDHASSSPHGDRAWDAPTLLAAMAGRTRRIALGVCVVNASLRHPFLLAAELAVAQAASGGRVEVGIGAGSHYFARYDHEALGIRFPGFTERIGRLDACCRVLPALWRGEHVTDEASGLRDASLGTLGIASADPGRWEVRAGARHRRPVSRASLTEPARRRVV